MSFAGGMLAALRDRGFTDIVPAHLMLMRWPGPQGQRPSEIAAQTQMTKQAVNYQLGQLEGLGYVERRLDTDDQRSRRVHLTPRGREAAKTMRDAVTELEAEWSASSAPRMETVNQAIEAAIGGGKSAKGGKGAKAS